MTAIIRDDLVLPQLVHTRARSQDGARPFLTEIGGRTQTYAEVDSAARRWARALTGLNVSAGIRVAVMLPTSIDSISIWLACGWLRAYEVPIHVQYRGSILRHILQSSGSHVLIASDDLLPALQDLLTDSNAIQTLVVVPRPGAEDRARPAFPGAVTVVDRDDILADELEADRGPNYWDVGAIVYTSGTTGPAKGVMVPWRLLHRHGEITIPLDDVGSDDAFYCPLPLSHIAGRVGIYNMAMAGGRAVLRDKFSIDNYWSDIQVHGCSCTIMMGSMAEMLWRRPVSDADSKTSLKYVLMGPLIPKVEEFKARFDLKVRTQFGMTETVAPLMSGIHWNLADTQSCGRVARGFQVRIADENDEPVAQGTVGELLIRSDDPWLIMAGYWNDAAGTAEAFRNQWFHTGDAFRCDADGNFYFVDRVKDTIRRRGENISSFFVEQAIAEYPAVAECAVVGVESSYTEQEIYGFVVLRDGSRLDPGEMNDFLRARLPAFMIPQHWCCVEALPRTSTQRVRKVELRQQVLQRKVM